MPLDVVVTLPFDMGNYGKINNTILGGITNPSPLGAFGLVAGDEVLLKLYPRDQGSTVGSPTTSHRLQSGFSVRVTGKPIATPGASTLLFNTTSFNETLDGSDYYYAGSLELDTTELLAALGSANSLAVMLVIQITDSTGAVQTFLAPITIYSPYYTGSEGSPAPATPGYLSQVASMALFVQNLIAVTGQTGGGSTKIDGIPTASGSTPAVSGWKIEINDVDASRWRLDVGTGTDVNVANEKVVPVDYNSSIPLVWTRYA